MKTRLIREKYCGFYNLFFILDLPLGPIVNLREPG